ncbi:leucine-rich repeat domain-containing protein [Listeria grandensis]|uniref:leucine-rich repeat domain-containing protein n=1 Tax=Listeria grandensis TaxID=1494963 RepID=UPI001628337C|nr:leucine-rich repeat domain-containing protein [Listeria grandensis]MBC1475926.1 leucine-rich repeat domain-containing protein [Listeria grandensis]
MYKLRRLLKKGGCGLLVLLLLASCIEVNLISKPASVLAIENHTFLERFPDVNLAKAVYLALHPENIIFPERIDLTEAISDFELATIPELTDTPEAPVSDLTGIEHLTALSTLKLNGNEGGRVKDIMPLADMKTLQHLTLRNEFIQDITPLKKLDTLQSLDLSFSRITSIEPLQNLKSLQKLILTGNQITDFRPIDDLLAVKSRARNAVQFEALGQTIIAEEAKTTGETSQLVVYAPKGEELTAQVASTEGEVQQNGTIKWLRAGEHIVSYQGADENIAVFLQQEVKGEALPTRETRSTEEAGTPITISSADGQIIDQNTYTMLPGDSAETKDRNSKNLKLAIQKVSQQAPNTNQKRGSVRLPNGKWYIKGMVSLTDGVTLEGQGQTTLHRIQEDFIDDPIITSDQVKYFGSIITMANYTTVRNLTLDGLEQNEIPSTEIQNGIAVTGNYGEGPNPKPPSEADYLHDILIEDVTIQNMSGTGMTIDLAKKVTIRGTKEVTDNNHAMKVENVGYDGIIGYSVEGMTVEKTLTKAVGHVGKNGIGRHYNIAASMRKMKIPDPGLAYYVRYPNSRDVTFQNNVVLDNLYWEGIDGHSVQGIKIHQNVLAGVDRPIVVGGQDYSSTSIPANIRGHYFPSRQVVITENRINQQKDIQQWQPENREKSQMGIAVWGTSRLSPQQPSKIGYTDGLLQGNKIDQVCPSTPQTASFGGIALKMTGSEPTTTPGNPAFQVDKNDIGLESPTDSTGTSVQLAGISLTTSNENIAVTKNKLGIVTYHKDIAEVGYNSYAPIVFRERYNNLQLQENIFANQNLIAIQDDSYGLYTGIKAEGLATNTWEHPDSTRDADLYSYAISDIQWDTERGIVTGKVGSKVGFIELYEASKQEALQTTSTPVPGSRIIIDRQTRTFQMSLNVLKNMNQRELYLVARNPHTNVRYQYKVNAEPVKLRFWDNFEPGGVQVEPKVTSHVKEGATIIQGTATPYAKIDVLTPYGSIKTTLADKNGDWQTTILALKRSDIIQVRATIGTNYVYSRMYVVQEQPKIKSGIGESETQLRGTSTQNARIDILITDEDGEESKITTSADTSAVWEANVPALRAGQTVKVSATLDGHSIDSPSYSVQLKPVITSSLVIGETLLTGEATRGSDVEISVGLLKYTAKADGANRWGVIIAPLKIGEKVKVRAKLDELYQDSVEYGVRIKPEITSEIEAGETVIYGTATPFAKVEVGISPDEEWHPAPVVANAQGNWQMSVPTLKAAQVVQARTDFDHYSLQSESYRVQRKTNITSPVVVGESVLEGTSHTNAKVDVWVDGKLKGTVYSDNDGYWKSQIWGLATGQVVQVRATQANGKYKDSERRTVLEKMAQPRITSGMCVGNNRVYGTATPGVEVTVRLSGSDVDWPAIKTDIYGNWWATVPLLKIGQTVQAKAVLSGKVDYSPIYTIR